MVVFDSKRSPVTSPTSSWDVVQQGLNGWYWIHRLIYGVGWTSKGSVCGPHRVLIRSTGYLDFYWEDREGGGR